MGYGRVVTRTIVNSGDYNQGDKILTDTCVLMGDFNYDIDIEPLQILELNRINLIKDITSKLLEANSIQERRSILITV